MIVPIFTIISMVSIIIFGGFLNSSEKSAISAETALQENVKVTTEDAADQARQRSGQIKGVYAGWAYNQSYFKKLFEETELNGIVIDVKEYYGINLSVSLQSFIKELQEENVWTIARIVVFRDSLSLEKNPEWYLTSSESIWQDRSGYYWLDPQNQEVSDYIVDFSKKVIDFGFDELQFDYIRYPETYGFVSGPEKVAAISDFFSQLSLELKKYDPSIILSVDLFGYITTQHRSYGIGQSLAEAEQCFDYLSFMLYPSHFYSGFDVAGVRYSYPEVVKHPYEVIYYSIIASGFPEKTRPFLQDFNLRIDTERGIIYDAAKIRAQIQAAEDAGASGWLFWNPKGIYTKEAFK